MPLIHVKVIEGVFSREGKAVRPGTRAMTTEAIGALAEVGR